MKENSIEKKLENVQRVDLITLLRQFKKEGLENFIVLRKNNFDEILSDYKKYKNKITLISEVCVDNSKQHINDRQSIKEIVKILHE